MARMCGRYTLHTDPSILAELFGLEESPFLAPRYNIAPTQPAAIVRLDPHSKKREWALVQWGLVPSWSKDPTIGARLINARSETVAEKPSFRAAFRRRRCLAPADGFYEWQKSGRRKQPLYITLQDGRPFAIAALWERWVGADGSGSTLYAADDWGQRLMEPIHNRMPVILDPRIMTWVGRRQRRFASEQEELMHHRPYPGGDGRSSGFYLCEQCDE